MNNYFRIVFFLSFFITSIHCSFSQEINNFKFVDIKEGITKRAVSIIKQDSEGFVWFGTNGAGLYKYDGINYKLYAYDWKNFKSINSSLINNLFEDSIGNFWVATDVGLNLYDKNFDNFKRIDLNSAFPNGEKFIIKISSIEELNTNELLVGTFGYGCLFKVNKTTLKAEIVSFNETLNDSFLVSTIAKTSSQNFYIGSSNGLYHFFFKKNEQVDQKKIIENIHVEVTFKDSKNNLWIGTLKDGLYKLSLNALKNKPEKFKITTKRILSIAEYGNYILCGTENDGLIILNSEGELIHQYFHDNKDDYSLKSNSIWSLLVDKENRIWLGFYNKGVAVVDNLYNKFNSIQSLPNDPNSLKAISVTGIQEDDNGNLWITTDGGGIDFYDKKSKTFKHLNSSGNKLLSDDIQTVYVGKNQQIWFGSWISGLYNLDLKTSKFSNYSINNSALGSNRVLSLDEDVNGTIWIGTFSQGLYYLNPKTRKITHCNSKDFIENNITSADVRRVYVDANDDIWLGTTSGLFQIKKLANTQLKIISLKDEMSAILGEHASTHRILSIFQSKDQLIWVGTDGGGLLSYNKSSKKFKSYNKLEGFDEMYVSSIIESENGDIWVAGTSGITKINRKNNSVINYTKDDGLLDNDFNYNAVMESKTGELYFGGYQGVNYFHPSKMKKNNNEATLFFTDFKLFNKSVSPSDEDSPLTKSISQSTEITLKYNQSVFTIDFIGLNYTRPEKHQYAYFMEGVDPAWNFVGNSKSATYTNLSPGNYVFNVKVANNDGLWTSNPLKLKITVLPPWYFTKLAYFVYFTLIIGLILLINWFVHQRFKERQAIKFEIDKRVQEEQLNNKKLQFFTNISHEFRTPLTLILNPLQDVLKDVKIGLSYDAKEKLRIVQKNAERLNALIGELMDFSKLKSNKVSLNVSNVEIITFVNEVVSYFKEEAVHRKIDLTFNSEGNQFLSLIDKKMMEKVLFNLISNAFKVTADKGKISVSVNKLELPVNLKLCQDQPMVSAFEIIVKDTGAGLSEDEVSKIFERFYQVDKLNKGYYGSTGIGLEVVKDFVELHKGEIHVSSKLKVGTEFRVTLPLVKGDLKTLELEDELSLTSNIETTDFIPFYSIDGIENKQREKTYTLLIVEDNTELRNYLKSALGNFYKIISARNGKIGLDMVLEKLPDIIITDVIMPEMNGIDLCKALKTTIKTSHIPLIMLTAKAMVEDEIEGIDSGADAYISKPFNMDILKSTLTQLLLNRQILYNKFYKGVSNKLKENSTNLDTQFVHKVIKYIHANMSNTDLSADSIAVEMFLSRSQLYRKIRELTGTSVNEFIRNIRLEKAKELIEGKQFSISEITFKVGFSSPSYFTKCFKNRFGKLPTEVN